MLNTMSDENLLRLIIAGVSFVLIIFIVVSWKFKAKLLRRQMQSRFEPEIQTIDSTQQDDTIGKTGEDYKEQSLLGFEPESDSKRSQIGVRKSDEYEKLVMLYLAAKSGHHITGAELVLAAEKVGLVYGHHNIYHRLSESVQSNEPVFSMANVIQPGYFDLRQIDSLQTPGVSFFMTLPGPVTAIQAWDMMLPIAERMAQLLDAVLLDSDRNALGRQRILHIKEDLRSFDRKKERQTIKPGY